MASEERVKEIKQLLSENKWNVNSDEGIVTSKRGSKGHILNRGYLVHKVTINGKIKTYCVHEIIAVAGGYDIVGKDIDHINSNKLDNRLCNLQVLSRSDNVRKANKDGLCTPNKGEKNGSHKLTLKDVKDIRLKYEEGHSQVSLSKLYNVHKQTIYNIVSGRAWK